MQQMAMMQQQMAMMQQQIMQQQHMLRYGGTATATPCGGAYPNQGMPVSMPMSMPTPAFGASPPSEGGFDFMAKPRGKDAFDFVSDEISKNKREI